MTWDKIWATLTVIWAMLKTVWPFLCTALEAAVRLLPDEVNTDYYSESEEFFASNKWIQELRDNVVRMKLVTPDGFDQASNTELISCYNGVGPDSWSKRLRKKVSKYLRCIEESCLVHDYGTIHAERNYSSFTMLNIQLIGNVIKEAKFRGSRQTFWCGVALAFICQFSGYSNFKQGKRTI